MGEPTPCARPDTRLSEAAAAMRESGLREVPVVDEGERLVGILTQTDLQPYRGHLEWTLVRVAMTSPPVAIEPSADVREAVRLLVELHVNALPVVHDGKLVGMVRRNDVLSRILAEGS